ncbi:hypothetical protein AB834_02710 [PVC group bacterium (ex Bugula neritina AB1)]|nr:hypothetical protein AB834_02710 [PVC group bacterium (ex Bugula neritina AB1)]
MFFDECYNFLLQKSDIFWWQLYGVKVNSFQKLYESDSLGSLLPHQIREVDEFSCSLDILVLLEKEDRVGKAYLDLSPAISLESQWEKALELAYSNPNKKWLPVKPSSEPYVSLSTSDDQIINDPESVLMEVEKDVNQEIKALEGVQVTTAEIYVRNKQVTRRSSTGLFTEKNLSDIYFEIAMEKSPDHKSQEVNNVLTSVSKKDLCVKKFIEKTASETRSLGYVQEPTTNAKAQILVDEDAISSFMLALKSQLNCSNEYQHFPFLKKGDVLESQGDRLSLTLDPFIPQMIDSSPFTAEGLSSRSSQVIEDGKVINTVIGNRFGQYLGYEPNGICGNMIVPQGKFSLDELRVKGVEVIEIIKFSSLLVDDHKLTWSSEIKLAKQYRSDGSVTWLKGGVVSGDLRDNLRHCYFSKEMATVNFPSTGFYEGKGYKGPAGMLILEGVSVVGS